MLGIQVETKTGGLKRLTRFLDKQPMAIAIRAAKEYPLFFRKMVRARETPTGARQHRNKKATIEAKGHDTALLGKGPRSLLNDPSKWRVARRGKTVVAVPPYSEKVLKAWLGYGYRFVGMSRPMRKWLKTLVGKKYRTLVEAGTGVGR